MQPKGRVLFMDDNPAVVSFAGNVLRRLGFETEFASDGEEAIGLYRRARTSNRFFDLVFIDLIVERGMGGREAVERLIEIDPRLRAVVVSGDPEDPIMMHYRDFGFAGALAKPFTLSDLRRVCEQTLMESGE